MNTPHTRKPQYHDLCNEYLAQVGLTVEVFYRKYVHKHDYTDDFDVTGELLEVKPQGLCIEQDNDDGEVFVPFSQIQAFRNQATKEADADLRYLLSQYYDEN
jgi:hypothetical protein